METPTRLRNRPYDAELAAEVLERLADGQSLRAICRETGMPTVPAVLEWLQTTPDFAVQYARARDAQADTLADEILKISDDVEHAENSDQIAAARLRVDARKWVAGKLKPKKYGDAATLELTGANGGPVEVSSIVRSIVDPKGETK